MIGKDELAAMKKSAIIVNTSRGPVIDEKAMTAALSAGNLFGAGLDVFDEEPTPPDNPLLKLDNVILTAHLAGPTFESNITRLRNGFDNVQRGGARRARRCGWCPNWPEPKITMPTGAAALSAGRGLAAPLHRPRGLRPGRLAEGPGQVGRGLRRPAARPTRLPVTSRAGQRDHRPAGDHRQPHRRQCRWSPPTPSCRRRVTARPS